MEFAELRAEIQECTSLEYFQTVEFMLFTARGCEREDWATVEKWLRFADELLRLETRKSGTPCTSVTKKAFHVWVRSMTD
jgi:hypothetical protein